jgi:MoaA/NifB/PqqE/SkfB family radical SAM enzyme
MRCSFCPYTYKSEQKFSLSVQKITELLDELGGSLKPGTVMFHMYNEPLIYPGIWQCIDYAKQHQLKVLIATNGLTLGKKNAFKLLNHSPHHLRISLHVVDDKVHNSLRGTRVSASTYLNNIALTVAVLYDNANDIDEIEIDLAVRRKTSAVRFLGMGQKEDPSVAGMTPDRIRDGVENFLMLVQKYSASFKYEKKMLDSNISDYYKSDSRVFDEAYRISKNIVLNFKQFMNNNQMKFFKPVEYGRCDTKNLGIRADGTVVPCCLDCNGDIPLGNINNEKLIDVLVRSENFIDELRKGGKLKYNLCKHCLGTSSTVGVGLRNLYFRCQSVLQRYFGEKS